MWKALIDAQKEGKVLAIGVSNFNRAMIEEIVTATCVWPAVNQIEFRCVALSLSFSLSVSP